MLGYKKNYATLALNYILKNSKGTISALEIDRKYRNNDIKRNIQVTSTCEHFPLLTHF